MIGTSIIIGNKYSSYHKTILKKGQHYCVARVPFATTAEVRCNLAFLTEK